MKKINLFTLSNIFGSLSVLKFTFSNPVFIYLKFNAWFITLVESWHGGESGDQDCEEASPDRAHRDQAQQGQ